MIDKQRQAEQRQLIAQRVVELSLTHRHVVICWSTGVGKGRAVMRCIDASPSTKPWLVLCPEIAQVENFKRDLVKHKMEYLLEGKIADVICYASFKNYTGGQYNLALNECHRLSELREDIAKTVSFDQIISDSATIPSEVRKRLEKIHPFYEYNISMMQAVQMGILPEPRITLVPCVLDDTKRYIESTRFIKGKRQPYLTTQQQKLNDLNEELKYWQDRYEQKWESWALNKVKNLGMQRKRLLAECKTESCRWLLSALQEKKLVCFTGTVDQAILLGGGNSVHSKRTPKANEKIIEKFNKGEIKQIFANRMMREGMNLDDIEAGIIVQLDSGEDEGLNFIQMTGRTMRAEAPEIFILYVKDSQDEKYLRRALSVIDKRYIKESITV
jgi:superfamily II DNA or RNA helicase